MAFQYLWGTYKKNETVFLARAVTIGQGVMNLKSKKVDLD